MSEYLERKLWKPLGAEFDASWSLDSEDSGFEKMESGINARAIDFARLGVLYLHDGRWLGRQIVPRSWIRASTSAAPTAYHYGYWWWVEPGGAFLARGNLGQFVFVDPRRDVVIARFGDDDGGVYWSSLFEQVASLAAGAQDTVRRKRNPHTTAMTTASRGRPQPMTPAIARMPPITATAPATPPPTASW